MSYCVYVHKNKHNGKRYVGLTSKKPEERWNYGGGYVSNKPFNNAIKKYGWKDGFEHVVIASGLTAEQAANLERKLIAEYRSNEPKFGYNLTNGGFGYYGVQPDKKEIDVLPEFENIKKCKEKKALFDTLVSIALGGRELETKTEFICNGVKIGEKVEVTVTKPNIEAIDTLIYNYEDVEELSGLIEELKKTRDLEG